MAAPKKTLVIVDGHAVLHRAWHAIPPLNAPDGRVVHGAYGFITILLNALKKFSPDYIAVTFDLKGPTFRHTAYEHYKATREKKPDELYGQVEYIEEILETAGIPVFAVDGFEADDVIGTLAELAKNTPGLESIIVTGDHDTLQLVDERTSVFTMRKGMTDTILYDPAAVRERYGFDPIQLIDYKALRGDTSDNIPGVKGIGEKTGTELIQIFGTIPALYGALDHGDPRVDALKPAVREKLLAHRDDALQAYDLCRIRRDVAIEFDLEKCAYVPPTRERMQEVFVKYGFMKLLDRLPSGQASLSLRGAEGDEAISKTAVKKSKKEKVVQDVTPAKAGAQKQKEKKSEAPSDATFIDSAKDLKDLIDRLAKQDEFAFRFVPTDNDPVDIIPLFLGLADAKNAYVVDGPLVVKQKKELARLFASKALKICHDLKRELKTLDSLDVPVSGPWFGLAVASYALAMGERRHSLDALLAYRRGITFEEGVGPRETLERELPHLLPVAAELQTELAHHDLRKICDDIEFPLAEVLARMERTGVILDVAYMKKLAKQVGKEIEALTVKIHELAGGEFNINSPAQLKKVLFDDLGVSSEGLKKTATGSGLSTAAAELEKLKDAHPIVQAVLDYRELTKLQSTYIETLPELVHPRTGRIHAGFNQTVAATGRLSSADPNLQNIPTPETPYGKKVRDGFVAEEGWTFFAADYSQFELRIVAHLADEPAMIKGFKAGEDIHWRTAVTMFGEAEAVSKRRLAKAINFGILYGMGPLRLAESAGITFNEAREYIAKYFESLPNIAKYVADTKAKANEEGEVETLFGRKRFFPNIKFMNPRERAEAERQAVNMPIQGSQADIIKLAMIQLDGMIAKKFAKDVRMIIQVHDELVFEVRKPVLEKFIPEARRIMEGVYKMKVPIVVNCSAGDRWGSLEKGTVPGA